MKKFYRILALSVVIALVVVTVGGCRREKETAGEDPVVIGAQAVSVTKFRSVRVEHDFWVDGTSDLGGTSFDVDVTGAISLDADAASNFNVSGAGIDLTLESEAGSLVLKGDEAVATAVTIDANEAVTTGLTIATGSVSGVAIAGGPFDVDVAGAVSIDSDAASNINTAGAGIDLTLEAEAGRVVIKGDEAAANGVTIDADDAAGTGLDIDVGASGGLSIDGGLTNVGGGTCATADGDNDLCVAGDIEVDGTIVLANTNFPLGYATSGEQAVATTQDITGTAVVAHGLTTVTWAVCSLGEDPTAGAGEAAHVTLTVAANVVTVKAWQDDFVTAATEADVTTHCLVIGTP